MTEPRIFPAILLFGPGTAILPSRPVSAPPARAAKVKGGHRPARSREAGHPDRCAAPRRPRTYCNGADLCLRP